MFGNGPERLASQGLIQPSLKTCTLPTLTFSKFSSFCPNLLPLDLQTKREKLARKYGVYYSCLLQLEYFDTVKFTAIDPMHNLFLGTAKHVFKLWTKKNLLTKKDLKVLEERIHSFDVGTGIG